VRQITALEDSTIEQFTHLARIVIERRRADDALKKSEAFLSEGQRLSHTGSWAWNLATDRVVWSEEHCRIFGYRVDQVGGTFGAAVEGLSPDERSALLAEVDEAVRASRNFSCEYQIELPDGSIKQVQSVGRAVLDSAGQVKEYIGTTVDITERKRAEAELRRKEADLRKAHADLAHVTRVTTMGELAASIAHEVNQPIAGVVLNGNACLRWLAKLDKNPTNLAEAREAVQRIIRDGTRAGQVIARIRSLFKNMETVKEPLDINEAIHEIIVLARSDMDKKRVALKLDLAADLPRVMGDRVQLQQVMLNLILNGIDAMSTVDIRPRELGIQTGVTEKAEVLVTVCDCGCGFDPGIVDQLFTAFHTTKPGGLGMGLSISRSIVENHGGRLWAKPNDLFGATFQFTLLQCTPVARLQ
jgi:PAS domain S-box-containing protein